MSAEAVARDIRAEVAALARRDTQSLRVLRRARSAALKHASAVGVIAIAQAVERGSPQEVKWMAYELIRFHAAAFAALGPAEVEDFASRIGSWYATDAFGAILAGPLWAEGRLPDALFEAWSCSENRWLRRAALTATVGLNAAGPDPQRTLPLCLRLADDRDDMVEKAVSWALRWLAQKDRAVIEAFMAEHGDQFRPRVKREVRSKLATGLKNPRAISAR